MRRHDPFDRTSLGASAGVHLAILLVAVWSAGTDRPPLEFISYQIELVSPPPAVQADVPTPAQEELVVERPEPTPPQPEEQRRPVVEERPQPRPTQPQPQSRAEAPRTPAEERRPAAAAQPPPEESPRESGDGINVRLEGVRRDYPAYYNNIIRQIQNCFRWQGQGNWETTVYFVIKRDGSVSDLGFVKRSGNTSFDFEAMGAVDCAGRGRFGTLPDDLPFELLPVQFNFRPQGAIRERAPADPPTTRDDPASDR